MAYQGVGYNELCLGRKNTRKEASSIDRRRKRKVSEEDSARSLKIRRNEKDLERIDDKPTPVIEGHNSEDNSDELPDVQL